MDLLEMVQSAVKMMGEGLPAGIVAGLISSAIIYYFTCGIKPKIGISKQIAVDKPEGVFRIKVFNKSRVFLSDVTYTLHLCQRTDDSICDITEIYPCKSKLGFFEPYDRHDDLHDYAVRISYPISAVENMQEDATLMFALHAKHTGSGTSVYLKQEYGKSDMVAGLFETGKSTTIIRSRTKQSDSKWGVGASRSAE